MMIRGPVGSPCEAIGPGIATLSTVPERQERAPKAPARKSIVRRLSVQSRELEKELATKLDPHGKVIP